MASFTALAHVEQNVRGGPEPGRRWSAGRRQPGRAEGLGTPACVPGTRTERCMSVRMRLQLAESGGEGVTLVNCRSLKQQDGQIGQENLTLPIAAGTQLLPQGRLMCQGGCVAQAVGVKEAVPCDHV